MYENLKTLYIHYQDNAKRQDDILLQLAFVNLLRNKSSGDIQTLMRDKEGLIRLSKLFLEDTIE